MNADGADFPKVARILKACGKSAGEILNAENSREELGESSFNDFAADLEKAGFARSEILRGLWHSDGLSNESRGSIVALAYDSNFPLEDIINVLREEDVDADSLDEEMRDADLDLRDRVHVLHDLFEVIDKAEKHEDQKEELSTS